MAINKEYLMKQKQTKTEQCKKRLKTTATGRRYSEAGDEKRVEEATRRWNEAIGR